MIDATYDPEADAAYIYLGKGKVAETREAGPFLYDFDEKGRVLGLEILGASKALAPGDGKKPAARHRTRRGGIARRWTRPEARVPVQRAKIPQAAFIEALKMGHS